MTAAPDIPLQQKNDAATMTASDRLACLASVLGDELAQKMLPDDLKKILADGKKNGKNANFPHDHKQAVVTQFLNSLGTGDRDASDGRDVVATGVQNSPGNPQPRRDTWDDSSLAARLRDEHALVAALVLSKMKTPRVARILKLLNRTQAQAVVLLLVADNSSLNRVSDSVARKIEHNVFGSPESARK